MLRQPIITVFGNVDSGKTQLLDTIRNTFVIESEPGKITQYIGCSPISIETIKKICGGLLDKYELNIKIPGFVILDTPGHAAFTNLRKRGGNLADMAILVIDINEGIKPQTIECIDILKQYKTPFVVALNKIDLLPGWRSNNKLNLLINIGQQNEDTIMLIEKRVYEIVGKLSELGFSAERFDRVEDYTKQVAIIPISAKTSEGIGEALMVIIGLSQKFLEKNLSMNVNCNAKGTVLEVKEEKGLGKTVDVIIYEGCLKKNDIIVIGSLGEPIHTKVKALFEPMSSSEMAHKKTKFKSVNEICAAAGVKIYATELDNIAAGMPLRSCSSNEIEKVKEDIKNEIGEVLMELDKQGIVIKANSLGSVEALIKMLKERSIEIKKADIGNISKKDISDAEINHEKEPLQSVVLGFNVEIIPDVTIPKNVKVFCNNVIYKLIEDFEQWQQEELKVIESKEVDVLYRPCKIKIMKGYVFRQNNPAVVGVEVLGGTLKVGTPLMKNEGKLITMAKSIQLEQKNVEKAEKGKQIAVSLPDITIGRQVYEDDILYSSIPEEHFKKFKEFKKYLTQEEISVLKEIAQIMRKENPMWGV